MVATSLVLLVALSASGCSWLAADDGPTDTPPGAEVVVYFVRKDAAGGDAAGQNADGQNGTALKLEPVRRRVQVDPGDVTGYLRAAFEALLAGPTADESGRGLTTELPASAKLRGVSWERPYAIIDFSRELGELGGTLRVSGAVDQIAYTATEIGGVAGVILKVEGERVGTEQHPFTGEGLLFSCLHRRLTPEWLGTLSPSQVLDLFIALIPDREKMWKLMGPRARATYGRPEDVEASAFSEGLGAWRAYRVVEEKVEQGRAQVVIGGDVTREGMTERDARYRATMVRENGYWKWDFPE